MDALRRPLPVRFSVAGNHLHAALETLTGSWNTYNVQVSDVTLTGTKCHPVTPSTHYYAPRTRDEPTLRGGTQADIGGRSA